MFGRLTFGLLFILAGLGLLLDQMGVIEFWSLVNQWWPLALIAVGIVQLFRRSISLLGGLILIAIGLILQAQRLDLLPASIWTLFWPTVLIVVGLWFIFARFRTRPIQATSGETFNEFVMFGGVNPRNESRNFKGGSVTAFFGGADVDLRNAELAPEGANLDLTTAFGGIELTVPPTWRVKVSGLPIFGGFENKTRPAEPGAPESPRLDVSVFALFGGVEVNN